MLVGRQAGWQARQTGRRARLGGRRGGSSGRRSWQAGRQGWIEGGWCRAGSGDCPPGTPCRTLAVPPLPQVQNLRPFYRRGLGPGPRSGSRLLIGCWSFSEPIRLFLLCPSCVLRADAFVPLFAFSFTRGRSL